MIKEVKILNTSYKIVKSDYSTIDTSYGTTDREKLTINIQSGLPLQLEKITLLHEILHAAELNTGIDYIKESQIEQFAHNLLFIIENNPKLLTYLKKKN